MSCDPFLHDLPLYVYGELSQEQEEQIEQHAAECEGCTGELTALRAMGSALVEQPLDPALLERARADLFRSVRTAPLAKRGWMGRLRSLMDVNFAFRVPAGALALVALGYLGGKFVPFSVPGQQEAFVNVRSLEAGSAGGIRVAFDDVRRRTVEGSLDDPKIRELVIAALRDDSNPGVRVEAVTRIKDHAGQPDVRAALTEALLHDPNAGVRMQALDALSSSSSEAVVRQALAESLLMDSNPGVRVKAIDLLVAKRDKALIPTLQDLMKKETNSYVLARCTESLRALNASSGTF